MDKDQQRAVEYGFLPDEDMRMLKDRASICADILESDPTGRIQDQEFTVSKNELASVMRKLLEQLELSQKLLVETSVVVIGMDKAMQDLGTPRTMESWNALPREQKDDAVLLLVDYDADGMGYSPLVDDSVGWTIGHNNDHNDEDEALGWQMAGWQMAGWDWNQDCYIQGYGTPIGWLPIPHALALEASRKRYPDLHKEDAE